MNDDQFRRKFCSNRSKSEDLYNSELTTRERSVILAKTKNELWRVKNGGLQISFSWQPRPWNVIPVVEKGGLIYGFDVLTLEPWGEFGVPDSVLPKVQRVIDHFRPQFEALSAKGRLLKQL